MKPFSPRRWLQDRPLTAKVLLANLIVLGPTTALLIAHLAEASSDAAVVGRGAFLAVGSALAVLVLAGLVAGRLAAAVRRVAEVLDAVAAGDLGRRVPVTGLDEVGRAGLALNGALDALRARLEVGQLFAHIVDQNTANIICADRQNRIRYVNAAAVQTLRHLQAYLPVPAEGLVGQPIDLFGPGPDGERWRLPEPDRLPLRALAQLGPETLAVTVSALRDPQGNYLGPMLTLELITEKLAAEQRAQALAESEPRT